MSHSVRRHLHVEIDAYDAAIRRWIPGYEEMIARAAAAVAAVEPDHVLDLGAGTGGLAEALLLREEIGKVELLDVDPEMMTTARARLASYGNRVQFTIGSFDKPLHPSGAVAASLSLHHVPTLKAKRRLYGRVYHCLPKGGVLVNADATMPSDPAESDAVYRAWADHMVGSGIEEAAAWGHFQEWSEEDTYFPLEEELRAMESVGFHATCAWQKAHMTVVVGRR